LYDDTEIRRPVKEKSPFKDGWISSDTIHYQTLYGEHRIRIAGMAGLRIYRVAPLYIPRVFAMIFFKGIIKGTERCRSPSPVYHTRAGYRLRTP